MKRLSLAIILACFTLAVAAQEGFRVDYQGTRPTIKDFVKAYLTSILSEEGDSRLMRARRLPLTRKTVFYFMSKNGKIIY